VRVEPRWEEVGAVAAFLSHCPDDAGVTVFAAADTLFDAELVRRMLGQTEDVVVAVNARGAIDSAEPGPLRAEDVIGLVQLTRRGLALVRAEVQRLLAERAGGPPPGIGDVVAGLAAAGPVKTLPCTTGWTTFAPAPVLAPSSDAA
jgi:hypothetical protein